MQHGTQSEALGTRSWRPRLQLGLLGLQKGMVASSLPLQRHIHMPSVLSGHWGASEGQTDFSLRMPN